MQIVLHATGERHKCSEKYLKAKKMFASAGSQCVVSYKRLLHYDYVMLKYTKLVLWLIL